MNISAITLFDGKFKQLIMNSRIELAKLEPEPTYEKTINDIKDDCLELINSSDMNLSYINSFDNNFDQIIMNNIVEAAKFEPEPTF